MLVSISMPRELRAAGCGPGLRPRTPRWLRLPHWLRTATGAGRGFRTGCEQVILHTEHTLGILPRCVFVRSNVFLPSSDCPLIVSLKSAKNLYLSHRFFDKIRQIHRFFDVFRQKLQILCRNQARLIQVLQVGYFSRREDLLATYSNLLATRLLASRATKRAHLHHASHTHPRTLYAKNPRFTCNF